MGRYCSYLLPKQARGTPQILVFKTLGMTGRPTVYILKSHVYLLVIVAEYHAVARPPHASLWCAILTLLRMLRLRVLRQQRLIRRRRFDNGRPRRRYRDAGRHSGNSESAADLHICIKVEQ